MKCLDCQNLLDEYVDRETSARDAEQVRAHLINCAACAKEFEALTAERDLYARYDREVEIAPSMWNAIAQRLDESRPIESPSRSSSLGWLAGLFTAPRLAFALPAMAVVVLAAAIGFMFLRTQPQPVNTARTSTHETGPGEKPQNLVAISRSLKPPETIGSANAVNHFNLSSRSNSPETRTVKASYQSDVIDADRSDIEDKETADHVEQAQNLLRSIRNLGSDDEEEVDVSYEKTVSRKLLDQNVVLRRDAEMAGKFPAKKLLGDLEPFLIDIANLPDKTKTGDLQVIKDRLQKTEMVAALMSY